MQWNKAAVVRKLTLGLVAFASGNGRPVVAQTATPGAVAPQTSLTGELQSLAGRAAVVFRGQVVAIERHGGVVAITFRVEQPVLGGAGATYVLREWSGLWPMGQFRYNVGERALIFVHAASTAGLASPVDGQEGVVPVLVQGADAPALLDIRRLAAAILRAPQTPLPTEADGAILLSEAIEVITSAAHAASSPAMSRPEPNRFPLISHQPELRLQQATPARLMPVASGHGPNGVHSTGLHVTEVPYVTR